MKRKFADVDATLGSANLPAGVPMLYATFAAMGLTAATIPATLPTIAESTGSPLETYLPAVPALFFGLMVGVLGNAVAATWWTPRALTAAGGIAQFTGFLGLAFAPAAGVYLAAAGVVGVGFGLVEAGGSVLARENAGRHTAQLLSALTGAVAVVAAGLPLLVALTPVGSAPRAVYGAIALLNLAVAAYWVFSRSGNLLVANEEGAPDFGSGLNSTSEGFSEVGDSDSVPSLAEPEKSPASHLGRRPVLTLMPIAFALLLYVGVETVYAGWSAAIPARVLDITAEQAAIGTAVFWFLLATGRYLAAYLLGRGVPGVTYLMCTTVVAAAALMASSFTVAETPELALAALALAVAALGPCYALIIGVGLARVPVASARRATGVLVACGALGGSLIPSTALLVSNDPTSQGSIGLTAVLTVAVGPIVFIAARRSKKVRVGAVEEANHNLNDS